MTDSPDRRRPQRAEDSSGPDWAQHWFPVAFRRDLEAGRVDRVHVGERAVALYLNGDGNPAALVDRCPHRSARLSDGRVTDDGRLECLYHGWQFGADGRCEHAPQQPEGRALPERTCAESVELRVEQGVVWAFGGAAGSGAQRALPTIEALGHGPAGGGTDLHTVDFTMDLPYGQDVFIENVLDVAHIHIAHSGTRGGGHRSLAGPLAFDVEDRGAAGFTSTLRTEGLADAQRTDGLRGARVTFEAPNLVHYESDFGDDGRVSGLALYSIPLGAGRCRMLYRAYGNLWTEDDRARPRWREHLTQCQLLEEDMAVVQGQAHEIDRSDVPLSEMWMPLSTSDRLVLAYRTWIETHAAGRPGAVGLRSLGARGVLAQEERGDRWTLHAQHCADCRAALGKLRRERRASERVAVGALVAAALLPGAASIGAALLAVGGYGWRVRAGRLIAALTRWGGHAGDGSPGPHGPL